MLHSLGVRHEDVQLDVVGGAQARRGRKVDARVADGGSDTRESAGLVLDLDDQVERNRTCSFTSPAVPRTLPPLAGAGKSSVPMAAESGPRSCSFGDTIVLVGARQAVAPALAACDGERWGSFGLGADPSVDRNADRGGLLRMSIPQRAKAAAAPDGDGASSGARRQVLFRDLNEEIRRIADSFDADAALELCCECELGECFARLSVSHQQYEAVRRFPTRFLVLADHVSPEERVVEVLSGTDSVVVEKIGAGARTAILGDSRKRVADGRGS
jgi:hypothetical protein